ncbi:MAG: hypothetical protein FJ146_13685 [Deltaproteobacteria bacterium]|nr:hypothetical protein [Deltaproteobacteria bacterium]
MNFVAVAIRLVGLSLLLSSCASAHLSGVKAASRGGVVGHINTPDMPVITLHCDPFDSHEFKGRMEGVLLGVGLTPGGYAIGGQVSLSVSASGKRSKTYTAQVQGTFIPPSGGETFKTNYIDAKLFGADQLTGLSLSLWPESGDFPMSAIYDIDGYRFGMTCSKSEVSYR